MVGKTAYEFSLNDINGNLYSLSSMKTTSLLILYFFDVDSRPSTEGLLYLNDLQNNFKKSGLVVWGITTSPKENVSNYISKNKIRITILLDSGNVSKHYNARIVLPTNYIIGPNLKVLDAFQGGGKSINVLLKRMAEINLQRNNTLLAKGISDILENDLKDNISGKIADISLRSLPAY